MNHFRSLIFFLSLSILALIVAAILEISFSFNYSSNRRRRDSAELTLEGVFQGFTPISEPP